MALGDGTTWDETAPTDATTAVQIDDYNRDLRAGVRSRMAFEHEWPSSQSATSEGGKHKFITLQEQDNKPTLSGTQKGALYSKTDHSLYFENSAGVEVAIVVGTAVPGVSATASDGLALALTGTQFPASTALFGLNLSMTMGQVNHGTDIPLIAGYNDTNSYWMVSPGNFLSASGTSNPDGIAIVCSASGTRTVTCTWTSINAAGGSGTGQANYIMIGMK